MNHLTCNIGCIFGRKEDVSWAKLGGLPGPFHRDILSEGFYLFFIKCGNYQGRPYGARINGIDPDLLFGE
ncbi:MAG TPA: hypothetical protein VN824_14070, partial [Puia sp.]|nr:hypothetical protein [Puia sp.]